MATGESMKEKLASFASAGTHFYVPSLDYIFYDSLMYSLEDDGIVLLIKINTDPTQIAAPLGGDPQTLNGLGCIYIPYEKIVHAKFIPNEDEDIVVLFKEDQEELYKKYIKHNKVSVVKFE